jgi:hypothetical protein
MLILTYLLLSNFMDGEEKRRRYLLKKDTMKSALPLRMQAYERLALFLERITPSSLVVRIPSKGLNVRQYQSLLIKSIRQEYEYNISMQIYVSEQSWQYIVTAKSTMVGVINKLAQTLDPKADALELSTEILNYFMEMETMPTRRALAYLKHEVQQEL